MSQIELIQDYLIQGDFDFKQIDGDTWVIHDEVADVDNIVIKSTDPLVIFSVRLMDIPADAAEQAALFRTLLDLNGNEMLAGAYGTTGNGISITEVLQGENLDFNEFQAAIDGLTLAISEHYPRLKAYYHAPGEEA